MNSLFADIKTFTHVRQAIAATLAFWRVARPGHDLTSALQDCYDAFMKADHVMEGLFDQCPERHLQLLAYIHVSMARFLVRQADGRHHPLNHLRGAIITDLEDGITLTWLMGPVESISGAYKRTVSESKGLRSRGGRRWLTRGWRSLSGSSPPSRPPRTTSPRPLSAAEHLKR